MRENRLDLDRGRVRDAAVRRSFNRIRIKGRSVPDVSLHIPPAAGAHGDTAIQGKRVVTRLGDKPSGAAQRNNGNVRVKTDP